MADVGEYETAADEFVGGPLTGTTAECQVQAGTGHRAGRRVRYDRIRNWFGVLSPDGYILTFFRPMPPTKGPSYFLSQCK